MFLSFAKCFKNILLFVISFYSISFAVQLNANSSPIFINNTEFVSSNLPIVVINTNGAAIVDEPKIDAEMGIIDNGAGNRNFLGDPFNDYNGRIAIEIRGSSSQQFPKKQYGFETQDSTGEDLKVSLLGLPDESDWILFAPYNDKSLIRDALMYKFSNMIGRYASKSRYCELILNNEYRGIYVLFEKIKRDKNRVDISKNSFTDSTGDGITGGYILKIDKWTGSGNDGWYSNFPPYAGSTKKISYQYDYPKPRDITSVQINYIKNFINQFESAVYSPNFNDSIHGYSKYVDVSSMVDFVLLNEMGKNVDAYRLSSYIHKHKESQYPKMIFGPIWDFNLAFGNANYYDASLIPGWQLDYLTSNSDFLSNDDFQVPFWWKKIFNEPVFKEKLRDRWNELRKDRFKIENIYEEIDSLVLLLDESRVRNFEKWPVIGIYLWPNAFIGGTYNAEVIYLKSWILQRLNWMDNTLLGGPADVEEDEYSLQKEYLLFQNYPNPFNPKTKIKYAIKSRQFVSLKIYDVLGNLSAELVNEDKAAGEYEIEFDGSSLSSGIYFYHLKAGDFSETKKFVLMK